MKEIYSVKLPKHIVFGDPWYFERYSGEELNRLIVDVYPHSQYQARVVLEEIPDEENPDFMLCSLSIYMAPEQAMQTYLQDMVYESRIPLRNSASIPPGTTSAWMIVTISSERVVTVIGEPIMR